MAHFVHFIDLTVTFKAADTAIHVNGVIKVNIVWKLVNLNPWDRLATGIAVTHGLKFFAQHLNLIVAIHTGARRGNVRVP